MFAESGAAELLDAAVGHAGVALVCVDGFVPTSCGVGGERAQAGRKGAEDVGDVAVASEEGLGEIFGGVGAYEVADVGARELNPVGGFFAGVAWADDNFWGGEFVALRAK